MRQNKIKLPVKYIEYLETQPEQGMGYQIVDVYFKSGKVLKNCIVLNSTYLQLESDEEILIEDIIRIEITFPNK
jgi:hypothetical protein